ncbi:hypothetical protein [Pyruvatibacter mobilis]|uniref:hypothetical protein n=1 Tax=Pyruvatibacter mobilis TaxID=1712261 RepID=UPI003BAB0CA3
MRSAFIIIWRFRAKTSRKRGKVRRVHVTGDIGFGEAYAAAGEKPAHGAVIVELEFAMTAGPAAFETQGGAAGERDGDAAAFDAEQHAQRHPHEAGHAAESIENFRLSPEPGHCCYAQHHLKELTGSS